MTGPLWPRNREVRASPRGLNRRAKGTAVGVERERVAGFGRLEDGLRQAGDWYRWGPYVSERQWGAVREDYQSSIDYEPAESTTSMFGGNSNWRGPIWT